MMPITATFDRSILADAARAEGLNEAQAKAILTAAPAGWLPTLVNHMKEPGTNGTGLPEWRKAFPSILNTGNDNADSFLIRIAVAAGGGVAV